MGDFVAVGVAGSTLIDWLIVAQQVHPRSYILE
jgi:hypothetical protein